MGLISRDFARGRLRYVLSPEASAKSTIATDDVNKLCYYYAYDNRGRLAVKRLPGAAEQWFVYNANNQLVASQDGNLRDAGKWLYYKYDDRGRMIEQGRYTATYASQSAAQAGWNGNLPESAPDAIYQFDSYPAAAPAISGVTHDSRTIGLKTYEKVRVLNPQPGSPEFIERSFYYDAKGRVIQQVANNIKAGTDRTTLTYNWVGDVLTSTESHTYNGTTSTLVTTATYDRMGKKLTQSVQADNQATATNSYAYDDLNRLKTKKYGDLEENTTYNL